MAARSGRNSPRFCSRALLLPHPLLLLRLLLIVACCRGSFPFHLTHPPSHLAFLLRLLHSVRLLTARVPAAAIRAAALFPARFSFFSSSSSSRGWSMKVAAAGTKGAGAAQQEELDLEVAELPEPAAVTAAAQTTEREAKRRRVHAVPGGAAPGGGAPGRRGRRRRVQAAATAVHRLFQACRHVFRGPGTVPKPAEIQMLRDMLDRMRPEDVGLSPDLRFFRTRDTTQGIPTITHTTIYKCPNFSMVILFLPRNAVIPLHNHPGMTVFSKLLLGSMHIKSYDWVDPEPDPSASTCSSLSSSDGQLRLANLVVDDVFTAPCDTSVLYPTTGGNMHQFTAIAPCAILDILGPPYSIEEDRDCTYYTDIPYTRHSMVADDTGDDLNGVDVEQGQGGLAWLKEIDMPKELKICSVHYGGPPISDK